MKKLQHTTRANSRTLPDIEHLLMTYFEASCKNRMEYATREKPLNGLSSKIEIAVFSLASMDPSLNPKTPPKDRSIWRSGLVLDKNPISLENDSNFEILKARFCRIHDLLNQNMQAKDEDFGRMLDSIVQIWRFRNHMKGKGNPSESLNRSCNVALCSGFGIINKDAVLEKDFGQELDELAKSFESRFPNLEFDIKYALEVCSQGVDSLIRVLLSKLNPPTREMVEEELQMAQVR